MDQTPLSRRAWLTALATSASAVLTSACGSSPGTIETLTPEGKILQWEGDDLLVIVSGVQSSYRAGDTIKVNLLVNNQNSSRLAQVRLRVKLLGRGDQAEVEAEVTTLTVGPEDAANADRELPLRRSLVPGDYTLSVEVPPWRLDGRETGRGATIRTPVTLSAAG